MGIQVSAACDMTPNGQNPDRESANGSMRPESQGMRVRSPGGEAVIFPIDREREELIDYDLSCERCGYNLKGTQARRPCPECREKPSRLPPHLTYWPERGGVSSYVRALVFLLVSACNLALLMWAGVLWCLGQPWFYAGSAWSVLALMLSPLALVLRPRLNDVKGVFASLNRPLYV